MTQPFHLNSRHDKYIKALEMLQEVYDCFHIDDIFSHKWRLDDVTYNQLESFLYQGGTESLLDIEHRLEK